MENVGQVDQTSAIRISSRCILGHGQRCPAGRTWPWHIGDGPASQSRCGNYPAKTRGYSPMTQHNYVIIVQTMRIKSYFLLYSFSTNYQILKVFFAFYKNQIS